MLESSLILYCDGEVVFESKGHGLRPLVECIERCRGDCKDGVLFDKVVGLAAAKLIVYCVMIKTVKTPLVSRAAADYLRQAGIGIGAEAVVDAIKAANGSSICPFEQQALKMANDADFYEWVKRKLD